MKTSKIIFISLLGIIAIFILVTAINIRTDVSEINKKSGGDELNKQILPPFKILCINDCKNISLSRNDSSSIIIGGAIDSSTTGTNYIIKGDTLNVSDIKTSTKDVSIRFTGSLNAIYLKNSAVSISSLDLSKLTIYMEGSVLNQSHSGTRENKLSIDSLEVILRNSKANLAIGSIVKLSGSLTDNSKLNVAAQHPREILLKRDSGSRINIASN